MVKFLLIGWRVTFFSYAPASRPLLLLLDGHCLPPNTTHATQPLDKTCFHALKQHWDNVVNAYMIANPGRIVTVYTLNQLFRTAWDTAMTPDTIRFGFRATGV